MNESNQTAGNNRHTAAGLATIFLYLGIALLSGCEATADAEQPDGQSSGQSALVGVWKNEVQFVDCTSNEEIGTPGTALITYFADGNLLFRAGNPAVFSLGQGRWSRTGENTFAANARVIGYDPNGFYNGYVIHERMITLAEDGQTQEYTNRASFFSVDDQHLLTRCVVGTGVRLPEAAPL